MLTHLRGWVRRLPWYGQAFAWPLLYFPVWVVVQILLGIWWMFEELYRQVVHGLQHLLHRYFWWVVGAVLFTGIALIAPEMLGPLLYLLIVVGAIWFAATLLWRSAFPRRKRDDHGRRH